MINGFEKRLTGGHPNSLGNTVEIVEEILQDPSKFDDLYQCYFSEDEVVRLRVSNAMKRIGRENISLLIPNIDRFLTSIAGINQASTQWTLATLFDLLKEYMNVAQTNQAKKIMLNNLENHTDWIVLTQTMETLGKWAQKDDSLKKTAIDVTGKTRKR